METPPPVRILTVCTGNICRSPVAERLLQAGLDQVQAGAFVVRSAGTRAMVGHPIQPPSADIIRTYGGSPEGFSARQLTGQLLREADLVLTMTSTHRGEVLQLDASLLRRTFTIREFARLLSQLELRHGLSGHGAAGQGLSGRGVADAGGADSGAADSRAADTGAADVGGTENWRSLPARAASVRHLALPSDPADNDVVDPYGRGQDVYDAMEDQLAPAVLAVLRFARLTWPA
ncbi:low molecular weight phosphatase family protein [uncultured Arthrobacter sp.]|uniref:arsenate reductase/protein-tyrosine-phosphatase family protein n=1 Tax=uncultured Arthrobacter sp. TaxID=114050 RepID=UPI0032171F77